MPFHPRDEKGKPVRGYVLESPEYDPFANYQITCLNAEYVGEVQGFRFQGGKALVYGLDADADEEEQADRKTALTWFWNHDGAWKRHINDEGKEYKRTFEAGYVIEPMQKMRDVSATQRERPARAVAEKTG